MLGALSKACGKDLPSKIVERRVGDLSAVWADPAKAERVLGWKATKTVDDMAVDAWRWQSGNPDGFV
jgi:UDP-glucose 4-epimerase